MGKVSLPIKTKVAAWWMVVIGGISIGISILFILYLWFYSYRGSPRDIPIILLIFIIFISFGLSQFIPGLLILTKKKWTWWLAIISEIGLSAYMIYLLFSMIIHRTGGDLFELNLVVIGVIGIPLILLLLDRKNFFKIASLNRF